MSSYRTFDQYEKLGEPPWSGPALEAWEKAHGHDVRLKCYVEFGCQIIAEDNERMEQEIADLKSRLAAAEQAVAQLTASVEEAQREMEEFSRRDACCDCHLHGEDEECDEGCKPSCESLRRRQRAKFWLSRHPAPADAERKEG